MNQGRSRVIFLHFGNQCPWIFYMKKQARIASQTLGYSYEAYDVTEFPEYAVRFQMFFPFMTVIGKSLRIPSPLTAERLVSIAQNNASQSPIAHYPLTNEVEPEKIVPLTRRNVSATYDLCIDAKHARCLAAKKRWLEKIGKLTKNENLGSIAFNNGRPVAVIEYLPVTLVPYPIPDKDPTTMFITCIYPFNDKRDFRGAVIEAAAEMMAQTGVMKIQAVAGKHSPYPNGPAEFFAKHGFYERDNLRKVLLREGKEELRLMERCLRH
jgi:hypothetical protein